MIDRFGPSKQACLLNADGQCNRIWVSQLDGLRLSHFQTLENKESLQKEGDGLALGMPNSAISPLTNDVYEGVSA